MNKLKLLLPALMMLASLSAISTHAQTTYPIPPTTNPDFIDYGGAYCNLFLDDVSETINGVNYEVNTTLHFTPNNAAATYGSIAFNYYPPNGGQVQITQIALTNITGTLGPYNGNSSFQASFSGSGAAGSFTGSLNFNIDFKSSWRGRVITYTMPNSYFTLD